MIDGPLFVGEGYLLRREVVALSESQRTESYWVRTRILRRRGAAPQGGNAAQPCRDERVLSRIRCCAAGRVNGKSGDCIEKIDANRPEENQ